MHLEVEQYFRQLSRMTPAGQLRTEQDMDVSVCVTHGAKSGREDVVGIGSPSRLGASASGMGLAAAVAMRPKTATMAVSFMVSRRLVV